MFTGKKEQNKMLEHSLSLSIHTGHDSLKAHFNLLKTSGEKKSSGGDGGK